MKCDVVRDLSKKTKLKGLQTKLMKRAVSAVLLCAAVFAGLFIFTKHYYIPIPFDKDYMSVRLYKAAVVTNQYGSYSLLDIDSLRTVVQEDSNNVFDSVQIVYEGIEGILGDVAERTISQNGGEVKVFYYCYKETLWDSWFADPALKRGGEYRTIYNFPTYQNAMYQDGFQFTDYKPQMIELYYLPIKNLSEIERLSDEEFDRLREQARLIWSGVV